MYTILVYEPEAIVSLDLVRILQGYEVISSSSVSSLIKHIREQKFDLIIINVSRIDGWTHLTKFIKKSKVPLIFLSTFDKSYFANLLRKEDILIEFPYNTVDIINAVESCKLTTV